MTGVILLAAGGSQRLGKPKQSLVYKGETFLQHAIKTACAINPAAVVVVLGSGADKLKDSINDDDLVQVTINTGWTEGLSSSIRQGLLLLLRMYPLADSVIFMVCDQPHVSPGILKGLLEKKAVTHKKIIASTYGEVAGVPALFDKSFFPDLLALKEQEGARKIIRMNAGDVASVPFPEGIVDIDTIEDYEALEK